MSIVKKSAIEDLEKDSTLKNCLSPNQLMVPRGL